MNTRKVGGTIKKSKRTENQFIISVDEDTLQSKESVKTKRIAKKGGKAAVQQEQILLEIENENTTRHIKELCKKFEPPACKKCPNRNADRVCVCETCGHDEYLSLICGKCHITNHTDAKEKPELDVEEFFVKLGTLLNETKKNPNFSEQGIDVEKLQGAFVKIAEFEYKLGEIEETFRNEIDTYKHPEEVEGALAGSVAKALSEPTYANIQEQLFDIKGQVLFENNDFKWNSIQDKAKLLRDQADIIQEETKDFQKTIYSSCFVDKEVDLSQLELKVVVPSKKNGAYQIGLNNKNEITLQTFAGTKHQQFVLSLEIDPIKKYALQFTLTQFTNNYFFIGLMKKDHISRTKVLSMGTSGYFYKRFNNFFPDEDCSKVLKGSLFGDELRSGDSFEMRFCIADQILEFSTLPGHESVVSKLDKFSFDTSPEAPSYVIAITIYESLGFSFNGIKEIFSLPSYC